MMSEPAFITHAQSENAQDADRSVIYRSGQRQKRSQTPVAQNRLEAHVRSGNLKSFLAYKRSTAWTHLLVTFAFIFKDICLLFQYEVP